MKIKQTIFTLSLLVLFGVFGVFFINPTASAATCGGVVTSIIDCPDQKGGTCSGGGVIFDGKCPAGQKLLPPVDATDTGLWGILLLVIDILTAGVGIAAVGGIIYGSILYTSAGGDPAKVKKAKEIIVNIVVGLIAYALMYSFLNYITPGGLFN